jgi:hypothetical protein
MADIVEGSERAPGTAFLGSFQSDSPHNLRAEGKSFALGKSRTSRFAGHERTQQSTKEITDENEQECIELYVVCSSPFQPLWTGSHSDRHDTRDQSQGLLSVRISRSRWKLPYVSKRKRWRRHLRRWRGRVLDQWQLQLTSPEHPLGEHAVPLLLENPGMFPEMRLEQRAAIIRSTCRSLLALRSYWCIEANDQSQRALQ